MAQKSIKQLTPEELATRTAKIADIVAKLPSLVAVQQRCVDGRTALSKATSVAMLKPIVLGMINFMEDMARVIYWLARKKKD